MLDIASDLTAARNAIASGTHSALSLMGESIARANADISKHSFVARFDDMALACAKSSDAMRSAGAPLPALAGLSISIKALFDVAGKVSNAGSLSLTGAAPASEDAAAVARLRRAGAAFIGHTNMTEFAYSGVGINPGFGTPANAAASFRESAPRIPGGSTSGGAVSVAAGAAWAALGSDTGGSIRIPAAFHGLVGFKNTQRLTPLEGAVPLSSTLDTSCAITRTVRDAIVLHEVLAARTVAPSRRALRSLRLAVPSTVMLDELEPAVAKAFERSLALLRGLGVSIDEIALPAINQLAGLQSAGGFAAAESWAWHRARLKDQEHLYDPRVLSRIHRGKAISAADYIDLHRARAAWIHEVGALTANFDAMLSPTVSLIAPEIAPLVADDMAFYSANARILRNPSVVNFLDGCALSLPCQAPDEAPVGLMVWAAAMHDDDVLHCSALIEQALSSVTKG